MDKLTSLLLLSAAHDDQPMYPACVVAGGVETFRTPWQDGWNAAVIALTKNWIQLRKWFDALPETQKDTLTRLLTQGSVALTLDEGEHGGERLVVVQMNMNDTFAYACADSEDVPMGDLDALSELWGHFGEEGLTAYAAVKRGSLPIEPRRTSTFLAALQHAKNLVLGEAK